MKFVDVWGAGDDAGGISGGDGCGINDYSRSIGTIPTGDLTGVFGNLIVPCMMVVDIHDGSFHTCESSPFSVFLSQYHLGPSSFLSPLRLLLFNLLCCFSNPPLPPLF